MPKHIHGLNFRTLWRVRTLVTFLIAVSTLLEMVIGALETVIRNV